MMRWESTCEKIFRVTFSVWNLMMCKCVPERILRVEWRLLWINPIWIFQGPPFWNYFGENWVNNIWQILRVYDILGENPFAKKTFPQTIMELIKLRTPAYFFSNWLPLLPIQTTTFEIKVILFSLHLTHCVNKKSF